MGRGQEPDKREKSMGATVTMPLDEVREYKPSPEEMEQFNKTQTTDFSDCPKLTKEGLG